MRFLLTIIFCFSLLSSYSQELRCNITINSSKIQGTNKQIYETLQKSLMDLMNSYKFTNLVYANNERINCNMNLIVNSHEGDKISGELIIQASRPVYNASYSTTLMNFSDKNVEFNYVEFETVEINNSTFDSYLTAIFAYYGYMIIGYDLDSFSRLGGTEAFQMAEQIVNLFQNRTDVDNKGWRAFDSDKNRYALVSNMMDERFKPYRNFYYDYHRLGLDMMSANVDNGRAKILEGFPVLREINRERPASIAILSFFAAKNDEIVNIFKKAPQEERTAIYEILISVNPASGSRYDSLK